MTDLDTLATEVGASGRTLRRAAARGALRCRRASERRLVVPPREYGYVRRYWPLIGLLLAQLRTQPNVRLAVVFGSVARGDEVADSDLDVLVRLRRDGFRERAQLARRLDAASGRRVQLVSLGDAKQAPMLLADVLRDGRVLVDRDGDWPKLKRRELAVERQAVDADHRLDEAAWAVLEQLDSA